MTREEAKERLKTDIYKYADFKENPNENEFWTAFDMAIKALEQEPRWIPVSERLPDKNGIYLVTVKQGYIAFGAWVNVVENWTQVTAWMPLPEPYAESEG